MGIREREPGWVMNQGSRAHHYWRHRCCHSSINAQDKTRPICKLHCHHEVHSNGARQDGNGLLTQPGGQRVTAIRLAGLDHLPGHVVAYMVR